MEEGLTDFFVIETAVQTRLLALADAIDFVVRHSIDRLHIGLPWTGRNLLLADLDFVNDIVFFGPTQFALRDLIAALENQAARAGL